MIYTLTTNPAIDMNFFSKTFEPSVVNRTEDAKYSPNGKGINVSLILKHYGIPSVALGFFGGFTGKYIVEELSKRDVKTIPIWVNEPTRINIFINDEKNEFKFVNEGPFVSIEAQSELINIIKGLRDCKYLVISGSLPKGIEEDYYCEIFQICQEKSIEVILDISSKKLKELLKYNPLLIKPNDEEVEAIFGYRINNEKDVKFVVKKLYEIGARNILLTMGEHGLYFYDGYKLYYCDAPRIKLLSSACAGDSSLAAFLSEWLFKGDLEFALKKASATGANVAESQGLGTLENIKTYLKIVNVREVK
ncbi:1-phosphofructokinase [Tepidimicrobium xylanilyticum]|uniref:1-phosphofructokinase n=1 Tax=Tepidimicrobium xylanilyticum TaxID=1123352 RepID=UPI00265219A2|nr:1-phosphofructokinase [Tepidimicrobium xylanilyticum]GMG95871.1 tagatose-6-phosphate kinase [Tepidimicrobium xylanilyticum]